MEKKIYKTFDELTMEDFLEVKSGKARRMTDGTFEFVRNTNVTKAAIAQMLKGTQNGKKGFLPIPNATLKNNSIDVRVDSETTGKHFRRTCRNYIDALKARYEGEDEVFKEAFEDAIEFDLLPDEYRGCKTYDELITKVRKNNHYYDELIIELNKK